ncbi:MAG: hypothetical protein CMJ85_12335 [Planctomycetes bacterium]|jgi:1,4-dihydroxy-6-naphthoate synthase|nr:hypothetical protein [Planctomycetota bacterium]MDP6424576.1 1,4-dihydroxy-6-naphthoate synthase [Planctomycetota bacterium]
MTLRIGISPCPNDTFTFAALLERRVSGPDFDFVLEDVETLNESMLAGDLDVAKVSFHAALRAEADYVVLPVGAAVGRGSGPLLLSAPSANGRDHPKPGDIVLAPGRLTTATLLYRLFYRDGPEPDHVVFSEIMPALERGDADFGVVIHEGRFTYSDYEGLGRVADLGELWEADTDAPLPLGGIVARRTLGVAVHDEVTAAIRRSLSEARRDPDATLPVMQAHAQEHSEEVLRRHVELWVTEATERLGSEEHRALRLLAQRARAAGLT